MINLNPSHQQQPSSIRIKSKLKTLLQKAKQTFFEIKQQNKKESNTAIQIAQAISHQKYRFPAVIQGAKVHRNANKFGKKPRRIGQNRVICPCCRLNINTYPIDLSYQTTFLPIIENGAQLQVQISCPVALFFTFIKIVIIYLITRFLITDLFNVYSSYTEGNYCISQSAKCSRTFFTLASGYNRINKPQLILVQDILNLITVVVSIIFFIIYRRFQYKINDSIDKRIQTQDDFALFVEDIPVLDFPQEAVQKIQFCHRKRISQQASLKIKNWLKDWKNFNTHRYGLNSIQARFKQWYGQDQPGQIIVRSVSICYDLTQLNRLQILKDKLMMKYEEQIKDKDKDKQKDKKKEYQELKTHGIQQQVQYDMEPVLKSPLDQIAYLNEAQISLCKKYSLDNSVMFNMTHFLGKAIICFEYQHYRQYFIRQSVKNSDFWKMKDIPLRLTRAATPRDIFWNNMNIEDSQRFQKVLISYLIMFMTLVFAFSIVLGLDILKYTDFKQTKNQIGKSIVQEAQSKAAQHGWTLGQIQDYGITIAITLFILFVNKMLEYIIIALSKFQRHKTRTDQILSVIIKLLIAQFTNSALVYYILSRVQDKDFLTSKGLTVNVSSYFILSGVAYIGLNILHIHMVTRRLKLWWKYRHLKYQDTVNRFQVNLNHQFQYPEFNLAKRYVYYLVQLYTACFYSYMVPIAIPIVILVFSIHYWIDKYNLFKRASLSTNFQFFLSKSITKLFEISLLIFALGNFLFSFYSHHNNILIINGITLIIAILYSCFVLFSTQNFEKKLFGVELKFQQFSYKSCVDNGKFQQTYWRQNPATVLVNQNLIEENAILLQPMRETLVYQYSQKKKDSLTENILNRIREIPQILGF